MASNNNGTIIQYLKPGAYSMTVPDGFDNNVLVYAWGAGGGNGTGARGGAGAHVATVVTMNAGDQVYISVGGGGVSAPTPNSAAKGGPGEGYNSFVDLDGGDAATGGRINKYAEGGGSGGGGAASAVLVNGDVVAVAAGGGGGGGLGDDLSAGATVGQPGGVYPGKESLSPWYAVTCGSWSSFLNTYGIWTGATGGTKDFSKTLWFPVAGTYEFTVSSDNQASWRVDSGATYTTPGTAYTTSYTENITLTAGYHTITATIVNSGGPGAWGMRIKSPDTTILYHTRMPTIESGLTTTSKGETGATGAGGSGGGGGGYPYGGRRGWTKGDDQPGAIGGNGGQNYVFRPEIASDNILTAIVEPGNDNGTPGGLTNLYPGGTIGYPTQGGAVLLVFFKRFTAYLKDDGSWKNVEKMWVKSNDIERSNISAPQTVRFISGTTTWSVPENVTSLQITVKSAGGGGGGYHSGCGGVDRHPGGNGGAGETKTGTFSVLAGRAINITVGSGGVGGAASVDGSTGGASSVTSGIISINALGGGGGIRGTGNGPGANGNPSGNGPSGGLGGKHRDNDPAGKTGQSGEVTITYQTVTRTRTWKEITNIWTKVNGIWKRVSGTDVDLTFTTAPLPAVARATINLVIASNVENYNLINSVRAAGYIPGKTTINLTVASNVIVGSDNANVASMAIDNFKTGDEINLINNGYIVGKGGDGASNNQKPRPGGAGGNAMIVTYPVTINNLGVIGGGGGGGSSTAAGPDNDASSGREGGGPGGGGAGARVGIAGSLDAGGDGGITQQPGNGTLLVGGQAGGGTAAWAGRIIFSGKGGNIGQPGGTAEQYNGGTAIGTGSEYDWIQPGGAAGYAIVGNSYVTFSNIGTIAGSSI